MAPRGRSISKVPRSNCLRSALMEEDRGWSRRAWKPEFSALAASETADGADGAGADGNQVSAVAQARSRRLGNVILEGAKKIFGSHRPSKVQPPQQAIKEARLDSVASEDLQSGVVQEVDVDSPYIGPHFL